jgi:signal transduction histidine kinase
VFQLGEGVAGQVVATGEPLIVNDYRSWVGRSLQVPDGPLTAIIGVPLRWQGQVIGVLDVLDQGDRRSFTEEDVQLLSLFADLASIALKNAELYAQVRQAGEQLEHKVERRTRQLARAQEALTQKAEELQRLLQITVQVQEEERTRIARDLHDGSNQLITGTLYEIQAAEESLLHDRKDTALKTLETAKELLRKIEAENRRIISGLRPAVLDAQGLVSALQWHVNTYLEQYSIAYTLRVSGQSVRLPAEVETAVYRIVQESLNNVAAHAQAREVQIQIGFRPAQLRVVIEDNGIGFDYERARTATTGRMGLIGIRERAQSIGGHVEIQSIRGQGTRITLKVPLSAQTTR